MTTEERYAWVRANIMAFTYHTGPHKSHVRRVGEVTDPNSFDALVDEEIAKERELGTRSRPIG